MKSRICARGDTQGRIHWPFSRSPTADREFLKILTAVLSYSHGRNLNIVDITRAFAQSSCPRVRDRYVSITPIHRRAPTEYRGGPNASNTKTGETERSVPKLSLHSTPARLHIDVGMLMINPYTEQVAPHSLVFGNCCNPETTQIPGAPS